MSASALPAMPAATGTTPMLWRCVLLAVLLHLWLLLLLGSAPGGTAHRGEGVWGAINVTLRGPPTPDAKAGVPPPLPQPVPPGAAAQPRSGSAMRQAAPEAPAEPGAAPLGEWARQPTPEPAPPLETAIDEPLAAPVLPATPVPVPTPAPAPALQAAPAAAERSLNSSLARPAPESSPLESTPPLATVPPAAAVAPAASLAPALSQVAPAAAAFAVPPTPGPAPLSGVPAGGAPDAGPRVGPDVATAPAAAASAPPRLNLELPRPRGGPLSRGAASGMLPLLPRPPETADKLGRDIQNAARPDCRDAHAGLGLLAIVPLAVDALRKEGGCKW